LARVATGAPPKSYKVIFDRGDAAVAADGQGAGEVFSSTPIPKRTDSWLMFDAKVTFSF